jgi:hypothetical protein
MRLVRAPLARRDPCERQRQLRRIVKMSIFVSGETRFESIHYPEFVSTFVYLLENAGLGKSRT